MITCPDCGIQWDLGLEDFKAGDDVLYVPYHAESPRHADCERGVVSSTNATYVFVKFGKRETAQACKPDQLFRFTLRRH